MPHYKGNHPHKEIKYVPKLKQERHETNHMTWTIKKTTLSKKSIPNISIGIETVGPTAPFLFVGGIEPPAP